MSTFCTFRPYILFICILFVSEGAKSQIIFNKLTKEQLGDKNITAFVSRTTDGFHWLGNGNGLHRYDGQQLVNFYISDTTSSVVHDQNVQSSVVEDGNGMLWFSTYSALHRFSPKENRFSTFQIKDEKAEVIAEEYRPFYYDTLKQEVWLRAGASIWAYNTSSLYYRKIAELTDGVQYHVTQTDERDIIWGAPWMNRDGLELFYSDKEDVFEKRNIETDFTVIDLVALDNQQAYLATNSGLLRLTLDADTFILDTIAAIDKSPIASMAFNKSKHQIWMAQPSVGVVCYDIEQDSIITTLNQGNGLSSDQPFRVNLDVNQNLWISYLRDGIDYFSLKTSSFINAPDENTEVVNDLFKYKNSSYALTDKGEVFLIDEHLIFTPAFVFEKIAQPKLILAKYFTAKEGSYLVGNEGVLKTTTSEKGYLLKSLPFFPFRGLFCPAKGPNILLTKQGVQEIYATQDSLVLMPCRDFASYKSNDFLSIQNLSDSSSLFAYRGIAVWKVLYRNNHFEITQKESISSDLTCAITTKNGQVYFGTSNGLYILKDTGAERVFSGNENLIDLWVNAIAEDDNGDLWLGTKRGLVKYAPTSNQYSYFSEVDGLKSDFFEQIAPIHLPNGRFLFATEKGLISFHPDELKSQSLEQKPYISELWINNIPYNETSTLLLNQLELDYYQNTLNFKLGGKELYTSPFSMIKYQLKGFDRGYNSAALGEVIRYANLPPGDYELVLQKQNRNGVATGKKVLSIFITPPYYKTWWFKVLVICAVLLLISGGYLLLLRKEINKQNRLREQQAKITEERDRIASELHDDIGGSLSSILYLTGGVKYARSQGKEQEINIDRIHELTDSAIKNMREMIWILDDERSNLQVLGLQVAELGKGFGEVGGISVQLDIEENLPDYSLSSLEKRNILLICKEGFKNIVEHSGATSFTLSIKTIGPESEMIYQIIITDNGSGFDSSNKHKQALNRGNGITNMKNRAQAINAELLFENINPTGARLNLNLKLNANS